LKKIGFNLENENNLTDYLSCQLIENSESKEILIIQPHLINNLEAKFGDEVKNKRVCKTPGTSRLKIFCPENDEDIIATNLQSRYRSGFGMFLYLIMYSWPDLCNSVRESSKCLGKATMGTYLEMIRVVKFVIDTKTFCLKIRLESKIKNWSLHVFYNSDWADDSEKKISITGFMNYLMNVSVYWRSKAQRGVTLSSSKVEYVTILETVNFHEERQPGN
jgi:hypothetical protein